MRSRLSSLEQQFLEIGFQQLELKLEPKLEPEPELESSETEQEQLEGELPSNQG